MAVRKNRPVSSPKNRTGARPARKVEMKKFSGGNRLRPSLQTKSAKKKKNSAIFGGIGPKIRATLGWCLGISLGLLIFFGIGVGFVYAYNFFTKTAYFAVKTIEIEGHNRLKSREVLEIAGLEYGQNTLALSIDELEAALAASPWVEALSVKRMLPDGIRIVIKEYEPRYWIKQSGSLSYADEYGNPIAPVDAGNFASLPVLEVEAGAEYLSSRLPELVYSLEHLNFPLSVATASRLKLTASRTLELRLNEGAQLVIGLDNWDANVLNLLKVLEDLSRRGELKQMTEIKAHGKDVWVAKGSGRRI